MVRWLSDVHVFVFFCNIKTQFSFIALHVLNASGKTTPLASADFQNLGFDIFF